MQAPRLPGSQFPGDDAQARKIRDLERAIQELKAGRAITIADSMIAGLIANEGSLTRIELGQHFLESLEGQTIIDGGTP